MEYADGKVKDLQIAYIGGGSRGWAWTFMTDLAMDEELSGTIRLYDIDAEAAKHNEIIGNRLSAREDVVGKWNYTVSDSLQSALTGADFIVISILPGTFDEMAVDVHMPERLGIYQSVGDTAGPGTHRSHKTWSGRCKRKFRWVTEDSETESTFRRPHSPSASGNRHI